MRDGDEKPPRDFGRRHERGLHTARRDEPGNYRSGGTRIEEEFGRLDILVNNAGILIDDAPPSGLDMEVLRRTYETNVFGPVRSPGRCYRCCESPRQAVS